MIGKPIFFETEKGDLINLNFVRWVRQIKHPFSEKVDFEVRILGGGGSMSYTISPKDYDKLREQIKEDLK